MARPSESSIEHGTASDIGFAYLKRPERFVQRTMLLARKAYPRPSCDQSA